MKKLLLLLLITSSLHAQVINTPSVQYNTKNFEVNVLDSAFMAPVHLQMVNDALVIETTDSPGNNVGLVLSPRFGIWINQSMQTAQQNKGLYLNTSPYKPDDWSYVTKLYVDNAKANYLTVVTKSNLPPLSIGKICYVSNATGGPCPAYCDGQHWRRFSDNTIIN